MTDEVFFPVLSLQRQAKKGSEEEGFPPVVRNCGSSGRNALLRSIWCVRQGMEGLNYGHCVVLLKMFNIKFICLIYRHNFVKAVG